ncbi:hypothetical protein BJF80_14120 [Serinicoccus sp. CUA-874]|nr:hypothetical protein BJF80_14120 [Serinicoccus sp. CUA-874]
MVTQILRKVRLQAYLQRIDFVLRLLLHWRHDDLLRPNAPLLSPPLAADAPTHASSSSLVLPAAEAGSAE